METKALSGPLLNSGPFLVFRILSCDFKVLFGFFDSPNPVKILCGAAEGFLIVLMNCMDILSIINIYRNGCKKYFIALIIIHQLHCLICIHQAYFITIGTLLYKMGRIKEAEENLKHALKLNPRHHGALNNLKVIEFYKNQKKQ